MAVQTPKPYQSEAVAAGLAILREAERLYAAAPHDAAKTRAHNSCVLLEAPTGSGKTRMAGMIAEGFSNTAAGRGNARVVWLWFTPFANLVGQAGDALRGDFVGLRVRDLRTERRVAGVRSGDVYITTWAGVVAKSKETRKIRQDGDVSIALDNFIPQLRAAGFRIGVVVDEAHHSFFKAGGAAELYRNVIAPDFTILITATPKDRDVERFRREMGFAHIHPLRVARADAVAAGLIKDGVRSVAYLAPHDSRALVDFGLTALRDGWHTHCAIKKALKAHGAALTPLMLVQVADSASDKTVTEARDKLRGLGVREGAIAWYTAKDPGADLQAIALDQSKEVLIFKMAVALGFDAPRTFTLVSLRGAQDPDFGVQVVGRILRVHPRLQDGAVAKTLPEALRYGYVFLADADNQSGLSDAAGRINAIRTEFASVCPSTMLVHVGGQTGVQVLRDGRQPFLLAPEWTPSALQDSGPGPAPRNAGFTGIERLLGFGDNLGQRPGLSDAPQTPVVEGTQVYALREDIPRTYQTEYVPLSTKDLLACMRAHINFDDAALNLGQRRFVDVKRTEVDLFAGTQSVRETQARLSDSAIIRRGQADLFDTDVLHPGDLESALLQRLGEEYKAKGIPMDGRALRLALYMILLARPRLLGEAIDACMVRYKQTRDTQPLPHEVRWPMGLTPSRLNAYGVLPPDLNPMERRLAEMLDADTSGTVEWWWRNTDRQPWAIAVLKPSGGRYYPDFVVKVKGRPRGEGIVLVETKGGLILNDWDGDTAQKLQSTHRVYGPPLMLYEDKDKGFLIVEREEAKDRNRPQRRFRVEDMGHL
jgi:type III restriction enzyme